MIQQIRISAMILFHNAHISFCFFRLQFDKSAERFVLTGSPGVCNLQSSAVSAQVAAEYGECISLFPQHPGGERISPCRHPVIRRIGFIGHFSEEFAIQPDPGEIVDDAEVEHDSFLRDLRQIENRAVEKVSVIPIESFAPMLWAMREISAKLRRRVMRS